MPSGALRRTYKILKPQEIFIKNLRLFRIIAAVLP